MNRTLISLAFLLLTTTACSETFKVGNVDGRVTSVGPVYVEGDELVIFFTTFDREGDDVDVTVEVDRGSGFGVEPAGGLLSLPNERDEHTTHVVVVPSLDADSVSLRVYPSGLDSRGITSESVSVGSLGVNP